MADWMKLLYVLVIALLYVPMVFLGANVFFPEFTGTDSFFRGYEGCEQQYVVQVSTPEQQRIAQEQNEELRQCKAEQQAKEKVWNAERSIYNGWKYAAITGFNLLILLLVVVITFTDAVSMGIFFGTVITAFAATMSYWDYARTRTGFIIMLVTFFVVMFIVNKRAKQLVAGTRKK